MASSGFLRTVNFGGFDKKDVLSYVDELNSKIYNLESELTEKNQLIVGQENISNVDGAERYEAIISENKSKISELLANADTMKLEVSNLENELEQKNAEISQLKEERVMLEEKLESAKSGNNSITEASFDIGSVFIEAKHSADKIITEAKNAAKKIEEDSKSLSQQIIEDANTRAESIINDASINFNRTISDANSQAAEILDGTNRTKQMIVSDYETVAADIEKLASCLNEIVSNGTIKMINAKQLIEERKSIVFSQASMNNIEVEKKNKPINFNNVGMTYNNPISTPAPTPVEPVIAESEIEEPIVEEPEIVVPEQVVEIETPAEVEVQPQITEEVTSDISEEAVESPVKKLNIDLDLLADLTAEIETGYNSLSTEEIEGSMPSSSISLLDDYK